MADEQDKVLTSPVLRGFQSRLSSAVKPVFRRIGRWDAVFRGIGRWDD